MRAKDNPFRSEMLESVPYDLGKFDWKLFFATIEEYGCRGAIIGPHGSGKTQFLFEFKKYLEAQGKATEYLRINTQSKMTDKLRLFVKLLCPSKKWLLADGYEQLPWAFRWVFEFLDFCLRPMLVSSHQRSRIQTLFETQMDFNKFQQIVSYLSPGTSPEKENLNQLIQSCNFNAREALLSLYDRQREN